jgi:sugar lactone lactonase YvrE
VAKEALIKSLEEQANLCEEQICVSPEAEVIWLKSLKTDGGNLIDYEETDQTSTMRDTTRYLNAVLAEHSLRLDVSDDEFRKIQLRLRNDKNRRLIEFADRSLHRVFNDGVFDKGGRFYGGWWQGIPREYRRSIIINGEPAVEADYSAIHPSLTSPIRPAVARFSQSK